MPDRFQISRIIKFTTITLLIAGSVSAADSTSTARLLLINKPESTVVSINDKITQSELGGWITVPAGRVNIKILKDNISVFSSIIEFKKNTDKHLFIGCSHNCAHIVISSNPEGAQVLMDGEDYGFTPYFNQYVKDGKHLLHLNFPGYAPLEHEITLTSGKTDAVAVHLERSQAWIDSVKEFRMKRKHAHQLVCKWLFGTIAAALAGAGIYYDMNAKTELTSAENAATEYDAARNNFEVYKQNYKLHKENAKKFIDYRNILLGASGAGTIFFGFSFVF